MNERIKQLQQEIATERKKIKNCQHVFDESFYNPDIKRAPFGYKVEKKGSDVWTVPEGYKDKKVDRWTRVCKKCGMIQHTHKQKTITVIGEPDFGDI